jgi:hypothetical protein
MEDIKTVLEEFHSVLNPFRQVQVLAQSGSQFNLLESLLRLSRAYHRIGRGVGNVVTMLWPPPSVNDLNNNGRDASARRVKDGSTLDPRTRLVIQKLRFALTKRFFYRYHPVLALVDKKRILKLTEANVVLSDFRSSYLFDIAQLFHPQLHKGAFIDENCLRVEVSDSDLVSVIRTPLPPLDELRTRHAALVKAAIWKKIRELAMLSARTLPSYRRHYQAPSAFYASQDTLIETPVAKRRRTSMVTEMGLCSSDSSVASASDDHPVNSPASISVTDQVDDEIQRYKTLSRSWPHGKKTRRLSELQLNAIEWWCRWGEREFPCLSKVALAVYGLLPGSGALECDIGFFKDILPPKRSRLDPAAVEMHMVVNKNKDLAELDPGSLEQLPPGENWDRNFPSRPKSPADYHEGDEQEHTADTYVDMELSYDFDPNDPFD